MNILVALDFSPATPVICEAAQAWGLRLSAAMWLLHVAAPEPDFVTYEPGPVSVRETVAAHLHADHQMLGRTAASLRAAGLVVTPLQIQGPTVQTILSEAAKRRIDLILMGSHGHGALHDLLMGSVSRGVVHGATCPVLVIPTRRSVPAANRPAAGGLRSGGRSSRNRSKPTTAGRDRQGRGAAASPAAIA